MNKREDIVLEFMKDKDYVPMKAKEIAMILGVPKKEYNEFKQVLDHLEQEFKIGKNRKNRYSVIEEEFYEGTFRRNQKGFGFVKIEGKANGENGEDEEVYI